jgi:DNA repair exonuclease SbcCD nuclease subunit
VPRSLQQEVANIFEKASPVCFFYVSGNHDGTFAIENLPKNVCTFSNSQGWRSYDLPENITITGADSAYFSAGLFHALTLRQERYNILLLHGEIARIETGNSDCVPLARLQNKGVDYLALGHIHIPNRTLERLDGRGVYRYCGCLEGRGFDELGRRGCFLLRIERGKIYEEQFLSFATREMAQIRVDISRCREYFDVEGEVTEALRGVRKEDCVKIVLKGTHKAELRKDVSLLSQRLAPHYFRVEIVDESRAQVDLDTATLDRTERGEFIRECRKTEMDEAFRAEVMEVGLKALSGEDIDV